MKFLGRTRRTDALDQVRYRGHSEDEIREAIRTGPNFAEEACLGSRCPGFLRRDRLSRIATIDSPGGGCYNRSMDLHIGDYISVDSAVCGGEPCFKGTRIMVRLALETLAAGETTDNILQDYPSLTRSHLQAALMYAAKAVEMGKLAALVK